MKNISNFFRNFKLPRKSEINTAFSSFSKKERIIFIGLVIVLFVSTLAILQTINKSFMVRVPMNGGTISEGIVGTPRFINPILATSSADQDLVALIYSGLMRKSTDGTLIPDLADTYDISKDGLTYTFTLKDKLYFQDGKTLTADDIIFTINKAKDSVIKSPQKVNWDGVNVEKIDERTVKFTLKQPYASFLDNTTLGIMPAHLWDGTPVELNDVNTNPIGSGPYMIKNVSKQSTGIIDSYELVPFKKFILGEPYLTDISLYFYPNEDELVKALENGTVDEISSITPLNAQNLKERNYQIESSVLPRVFGLFFNQNVNQLFTDKVITNAINQTIDKEKIIHEVFFGYGKAIDDPIPSNIIESQTTISAENTSREEILQKVQASLAKDGWKVGADGFLEKTTTQKKKNTTTKLAFSISTGNMPELTKTAELIRQDLAEVGIQVDVKTFEIGNLNQTVIRPRKYDALLFGEIINHESDLFAFWHSTQRKDPGLNVAMYTNVKVDKILEEASIIIDEQARIKKYIQFESEIKKDLPAVFLYSPDFVYVVPKNLNREQMKHIISPSDRYLNVYSWYTETDNVWKIFTK
ncbi:MAG: ABC transporter substrate-binding protein [Candidatus Parcubacteria bacterium]|nr:ABC transporter substrate-binding protein [Candidatus Parcubacteria bacterium]